MNDNPAGQVQQNRRKQKNLKKIIVVVIAVVLVGAVIGGVYYAGFKNGEKQGQANAKKEMAANPFANLGDANRFLPKYKTGEIVSISKDSIVVKTTDKDEKFTVSDKTKVTRKTETLSLSNLKKGDKVTVFTANDGVATRIVLKSN
ncbi:hypothetical protein IPM44_04490 [bacterium]|jgi:flagellar basal body-associated protein FliL|nr:MAG: hypothetical protein IPM44_04490 [bacterium]